MKKLIGELHRRSLWQVLGIYLAGSWLALQVVDVVNQNFGLPDWVAPFALILLVIGLPIVLATAFVQEGIGARSAIKDEGSEDEAATQTTKPSADNGGRHGLFTWRNAMTGGVLAFALLGVVAGGYMAMRTLGIGPAASLVAAGVFDERDRVVVAEFESVSGDGALAEAATEALRVDLTQSPIVTVVEPRYVARVLERMERAPDSRLDRQLAMELAIREGIKAVVAGEINAAGRGFVLTAELVAAGTGEVLASQRETARDTASVIDAIDQLSRQLRERIGESLRSTRANAPLEQVTTSSLEALRKFSQGVRAIDIETDGPKGVAFLEEAVALDTAFAMAWRKLGTELRNMAEPRSRWVDAMSRAVAHSDRLTERERYLTLGTYYHTVTGDMDRAIRAFESMLELDPTDNYAFGNLAVVYNELRDGVRAEALMSRALEADSFFTFNYTLLMDAQINQGKTDQATATLASFTRHFPSSPSSLIYSILLAGNRRDYPAVDEGALELADQWPNLYRTAQASRALALSAAASGKLEEAEERFKDAEEAEAQRGALPRALNAGLGPVWLDLLVRRETEQAVDRLEEVLQRYPLQNLDAADRPYLELASLLAVAGEPDRAAAMVDEWEELTPEELRNHPSLTRARSRAEGDIASIEGRHSEAIEVFRRSDESGCRLCPLRGLAAAYDAAGERDSAIATYERYIHTPTVVRLIWDGFELPSAYERVAQLYDAQGDLENAARYYAMFVELWVDADEELQPRVRAAQARLEEILRERG